ncbi:hypothetical protein H0H81_000625 [Sphagnurus paluster]|uniref:Uncharacterized protein n=1 Tax=Sphagnurus paluster TaxID=117069 RepID=A0A9P7K354_9AGAR|nr:hypothetical protein H0H81_000625 [Sphagnurus paluster]
MDAMFTKKQADELEENRNNAIEISVTADFMTAVGKGKKKRLRSPSPILEEQPSASDNNFEDIPAFGSSTIWNVKRKKNNKPESDRQTQTQAAPTSWVNTRSASAPTRQATSISRQLSPSAEDISQALKAQWLPTNKEISPFLGFSMFNIVTLAGISGKNFYLGKPIALTLQLNLAPWNMKKGGFKLAAFGSSMPAVFEANGVCAKHTYHPFKRVVDVGGSLAKKVVDVPHEGEKQFKYLTMEVSCLVWAQALLNIVYDFVKETNQLTPFPIPQFRFVKAAMAIKQSLLPGVKKTAFLLEEIIDPNTEGKFRKYLNNVSPEPLVMKIKEDMDCANFLVFSQQVQYFKTKKQVFVSDYQGKQ